MKMHKQNVLLLTLGINLIFFVFGYYVLTTIEIDWLRQWMAGFGYYAPVIYVLTYILFFVVPFNPIPKGVITYFALLSFGPLTALILSLMSDFVSITINYSLFRNFHSLLSNKKLDMIKAFAKKNGWQALLVMRTLPITNGYTGADFPSYASGIVRMPYLQFIVASMTPWIIQHIIYFFGIEALLGTPFIVPLFILFIIFSVGYTIYRYKKVDLTSAV
jgi:uncharacterized membrane protein YdjX (TVP38/TMEM64 family)